MEDQSVYISVVEAAELLGVSGARVRQYVSEGRLGYFRVGKRTLAINRADCLDFQRKIGGRKKSL